MSTPVIFILGKEETYVNYISAVRACGGTVRCAREPDEAGACQGLLLPGGGDVDPALYGRSARGALSPNRLRDQRELDLIRQFADAGKPIFGICRGVQILNVFFGGTLIQDLPHHRQIAEQDQFHRVVSRPDTPLRRMYGDVFTVNSAHHQAVDRPGAGLRIDARAEDGVAEALCHETLPVFGVQWHPERLTGAWSRADAPDGRPLFEAFIGLCGADRRK